MKLKIKELAVLSLLGALMCASDFLMDVLPNVHLIGVLIVATTVVYRKKAIWAIYTYVFTLGLISGFPMWWIPYLYIWAVLWGMALLIPKKLSEWLKPVIYAVVCSLHGFMFGLLYSPSQALMFGLDFKGTLAWIVAGLPFDMIHGVSNLCFGLLIYPIVKILIRTTKQ